jgi:gluconokinase
MNNAHSVNMSADKLASLPHAIVVMGVCGTGKSTIGIQLADTLGWAYADADDFHPPANVAKMRAGTPLNDEDRAPWLATLRDHLQKNPRTILACSALKLHYRDVLRSAATDIRVVYLRGDRELLASRLGSREGHYMPSSLLDSQLAALEEPSSIEAIWCDIALPPAAIVATALDQLRDSHSS